MRTTHIFFDVGGVLGTPGWDSAQRQTVATLFGLDAADLETRHASVSDRFERGRLSLEEYLDTVVFWTARSFSRAAFRAAILEQSIPSPESIAVARGLSENPNYRLMTINNESAELNAYRLREFGLQDIFAAFFSSCWLGFRKPDRRIYQRALAISQADAERSVFIDDREVNLPPARALGMHAIRFTNVEQLVASLQARDIAV